MLRFASRSLVLVVLAACSSGSNNGTATSGSGGTTGASGSTSGTTGSANGGGSTTPAQLFAAVTTDSCNYQQQCSPVAAYVQAQCTNIEPTQDGLGQLAYELDAGFLAYNASAASTCLTAAQTVNCSTNESLSDPSCSNIFSGAVATGGYCFEDLDCKSGYCVNLADGGCGGTCSPYLQLSADCSGSDAECDPSLECDSLPDSGYACIAPVDAGVTANALAGQACGVLADGGYVICAGSLFCPTATSICTAPSSSGPCSTADYGACTAPTECVAAASATTGTCMAQVDVGGACQVPTAGAYSITGCLAGLACVGASATATTGACQIPPSTGACGADVNAPCEVLAHYCNPTTSTCQPLGAAGATCDPNNDGYDCVSQNCDSTSDTCVAATCSAI